MHDIEFIRQNPKAFDQAMNRRGMNNKLSDEILALDKIVRFKKTELQELLNQKNLIAKEIGIAKGQGKDIKPILAQADEIKQKIKNSEDLAEEKELKNILSSLPNILSNDTPDRTSIDDNLLISDYGTIKNSEFSYKLHDDLLVEKDFADFKQAAKVSGARFVYLKGVCAKLERVLADYFINILVEKYNFLELSTPYLVNTDSLYGTGQLPKFAEDNFKTTDNRWLIPTAEVSLVNYFRQKRINNSEFPIRLCSFTNCFRSEAGAAGKDTKGMFRMHQFSKVEMVSITNKISSFEEHELLLSIGKEMLENIDLPYRVMLLNNLDTGFTAHKTYDLEVWMAGQNQYREISSISNCLDFQARRANIKYKDKDGKLDFAHSLNGSGLAIGRTIIAIVENYQNKDGTITIPEVLRSYFKGNQKF